VYKDEDRDSSTARTAGGTLPQMGIVKLELFGSALRDDFDRTKSDVDMLVTFAPGALPGWDYFAKLPEDLARIFGRKVDIAQRSAPWNTAAIGFGAGPFWKVPCRFMKSKDDLTYAADVLEYTLRAQTHAASSRLRTH
jgi:predicted nucleotidyltransferase